MIEIDAYANYNSPVAENVAAIIRSRGLKQCAVAEKAGYSSQALSNMLNGKKLMKTADVIRLADALGVTYDEIYKKGGD